jgi:ribosome modulation factor
VGLLNESEVTGVVALRSWVDQRRSDHHQSHDRHDVTSSQGYHASLRGRMRSTRTHAGDVVITPARSDGPASTGHEHGPEGLRATTVPRRLHLCHRYMQRVMWDGVVYPTKASPVDPGLLPTRAAMHRAERGSLCQAALAGRSGVMCASQANGIPTGSTIAHLSASQDWYGV